MALIYGCLPDDVLNFERAARFNQKVVTKPILVVPERLTPHSDVSQSPYISSSPGLVRPFIGSNYMGIGSQSP